VTAPANWTWNWTWCGDIAPSGITAPIDTGMQEWIWTWNLGGSCTASPSTQTDIGSQITTQIGGAAIAPPVITPAAPTIALLTPPVALAPVTPSVPVAPTLPVVMAPTPPEIVLPVPPLAPLLDPAFVPPTSSTGTGAGAAPGAPFDPPSAQLQRRTPAEMAAALATTIETSSSVAASAVQPERTASGATRASRPHADSPSLPIAADLQLGGNGAGAAAASAGGSAGAAAAVAIWLIFLLPGFTLRRILPTGRRGPRSRAGEIITRPG
jgi:hypothetical protein